MSSTAARPIAGTAFYCVADSRYFPGAVALIDSLRLLGHDEPVFVLDCGLEPAQRALLGAEATLLDAPEGTAPYLLKTVAPLARPAERVVLIDADIIVTRSLGPVLELADEHGVAAFRNDSDRFVAEWGSLLELGELTRRPYVSSSLVAFSGDGLDALRLLDDRQRAVEFSQTFYGSNDERYPFRFPEQDVLNAILCARGRAAAALDHRLAPNQPFAGLRLTDERLLRCAYSDGTEPYVLHHYLEKPWLAPMYHGIYSRLFVRLVLGDDTAIRLDEGSLPLRMRSGLAARLERARVDAVDALGWRARSVLPAPVIARVDERRRRRVAGG